LKQFVALGFGVTLISNPGGERGYSGIIFLVRG
jgi:hypothetical protein